MHRYHTLKYLKNSKKTVEKFKLTDQRRNKALPCSYVDQYAQLFNAEGISSTGNAILLSKNLNGDYFRLTMISSSQSSFGWETVSLMTVITCKGRSIALSVRLAESGW